MKVLIRVTRRTEYASIVEMPEEKFRELQDAIENGPHMSRVIAEKEANRLIDTKDWQDDSLDSVDEFEEFKEEQDTPSEHADGIV